MPGAKLRAEVGPPPKLESGLQLGGENQPETGPRELTRYEQQWIAGVVGGFVHSHDRRPEIVTLPRPKSGKKSKGGARRPALTKRTVPVEVTVNWGSDSEDSEGETDAPDAPGIAPTNLPTAYGALAVPELPAGGPTWCPATRPIHGFQWALYITHLGLSIAGLIILAESFPTAFSIGHCMCSTLFFVSLWFGAHWPLMGALFRRLDFWVSIAHLVAFATLAQVLMLKQFDHPDFGLLGPQLPPHNSGVPIGCVVVVSLSFTFHGVVFLNLLDALAIPKSAKAVGLAVFAGSLVGSICKISARLVPTLNGEPFITVSHGWALLAFFYVVAYILMGCFKAFFRLVIRGGAFSLLGFEARWVHMQPEKPRKGDDPSSTFVNIETLEAGEWQAEGNPKDPHWQKYSNFVYDDVYEGTKTDGGDSPISYGSNTPRSTPDASEASEAEPWPPALPGTRKLPRGPYDVVVGCSMIDKRGVFAERAFAKGEVVEVCPYLPVRGKEVKGAFKDYTFEGDESGAEMFILGYGSLYNSCTAPNLDINHNEHVFWLTANLDIEEGEELFIDYGPSWFKDRGYDYKEPGEE